MCLWSGGTPGYSHEQVQDLWGSTGRFADGPRQCHSREPLLSQTGCSRAVLCIKISAVALRALPCSLSQINFHFICIFLPSAAPSTLCVTLCSLCRCPLSRQQSCTWPLPVINVGCVAAYVSNHNSSVKAPLPDSGRNVWAHRALQCLYKAGFQ